MKVKKCLTEGDFGIQNPDKIDVIPCCVDTVKFDPEKFDFKDKDQIRHDLKIGLNQFVLGYIGSVGTWYLLDEMMAFFKVQLQKSPDAKFVFLSGQDPEIIYQSAEKNDVPKENVLVKKLPFEDGSQGTSKYLTNQSSLSSPAFLKRLLLLSNRVN